MNQMRFHEYAEMFPLIQGKEFVALKQDIKENGLSEPIVTYKGEILDGRNRFRACQEVGVTPDYFEYGGADPLKFVISHNLHRRHLNESQRAMVGAKLANMGGGTRTDLEPTAQMQEVSRADAADMLNVSERSVNNAKKIQTAGIPELVEKVEAGEIKVTKAAGIAALPPQQQKEEVKNIGAGKPQRKQTTTAGKVVLAVKVLSDSVATGSSLYRSATEKQKAQLSDEIRRACSLLNQIQTEVTSHESN